MFTQMALLLVLPLCAEMLGSQCVSPQTGRIELHGYVSNGYEPKDFILEVEQKYPCWVPLCEDALCWKAKKLRRKFWFESVFYGCRDRKVARDIQHIALTHGIEL